MNEIISIVLAAGHGTRMKSNTLKCLHKIAGLSMIDHIFNTLTEISSNKNVLVVSEEMNEKIKFDENIGIVVQKERLGTGHAVLQAKNYFKEAKGDVVIIYGDNPLITAKTIKEMIAKRRDGMGLVVLGFKAKDPAKYGRFVLDKEGLLEKIVEFKDASEEEKAINLCNSGVMCFDGKNMYDILSNIKNENKAGEYYLTDAVKIARDAGLKVGVVIGQEDEMLGVNSRFELANAERVYQQRKRKELMESGVTMLNPETVYVNYDTEIGKDVVIEPNVFFGEKVKIHDNVTIKAFSHIEGAEVKEGAIIGPFARLRPGSTIETEAHIGNFVEIKNSVIGNKSKVNHLTYIGDTDMGKKTNIGAGTITCNYDGYFKSRTTIGDNVFVGSHSCLVAPVTLGNGSFTAAGSTITKNVGEDDMGISRAKQENKEGWAKKYHETKQALKNAKK